LFLAHAGAIKGSIHALLRDRSLVEDVLQETFLVVSAKAASFQPGTNFVAWACTIARFKVLETIRRRARLEHSLSLDVIEALAAHPPEEENRESTLTHLESCLNELGATARRVVDLRYFQARPPEEIARLLSLTVESVYVALSRSRRTLRMCVAGKLDPAA
jgi:RNA polymerase sigma-70 factor (ECF subfamily)